MLDEKTKIKEYNLRDAERDSLGESLTRVEYDDAGPFNPFVHSARRVFTAGAADETMKVLDEFRNSSPESGILVIHNCPFDSNVQRGLRDGENARQAKADDLSEAFLTGLTAQVGEPYSIHYEGTALVNNLCPSKKEENKHTVLGSREPLGLHIENAAARRLRGDRSPEGLVLSGVSKEPEISPPTTVSDARLALSLCAPNVEQELRRANFEVRFPDRWYPDGMPHKRVQTSIIEGSAENPSFVAAFYSDMLIASTSKAEKALAEFSGALESVATAVYLEPGMTLLVNNRAVFHGRGSFKASFDRKGRPFRWVQRLFFTSSLQRMGEWKWVKDRVVLPVVDFSQLSCSTA